MTEIIRKSIIREATLADGYGSEGNRYDYSMKLPPNLSSTEQRRAIEEQYNKIRNVMGGKPKTYSVASQGVEVKNRGLFWFPFAVFKIMT